MNDVIDGKVISTGGDYKTGPAAGSPMYEITIPIGRTGSLPVHTDERVPIRLRVADVEYHAGLRSTPKHDFAWVCPDVRTTGDAEDKLGRILKAAGFTANEHVQLLVSGDMVEVRRG